MSVCCWPAGNTSMHTWRKRVCNCLRARPMRASSALQRRSLIACKSLFHTVSSMSQSDQMYSIMASILPPIFPKRWIQKFWQMRHTDSSLSVKQRSIVFIWQDCTTGEVMGMQLNDMHWLSSGALKFNPRQDLPNILSWCRLDLHDRTQAHARRLKTPEMALQSNKINMSSNILVPLRVAHMELVMMILSTLNEELPSLWVFLHRHVKWSQQLKLFSADVLWAWRQKLYEP